MPEPTTITIDVTTAAAAVFSILTSGTAGGIALAICKHLKRFATSVLDELHGHTKQLVAIDERLERGEIRFEAHEQRIHDLEVGR